MAYLTNSSFSKLISTIDIQDIDITKEFFTKYIFNDEELYYFFNSLDLKKLLKIKALLDDDTKEILVFKHAEERPDTKQFVFNQGGKIKYHLYKDCGSLSNVFKDFYIPEDVQRLDKELENANLIEEVRNWFKEQNFTRQRLDAEEISIEFIITEYNAHFPKKYPCLKEIPLNSNILIDIPSSGFKAEDDYFNKEYFLKDVQDLKKERKKLFIDFNHQSPYSIPDNIRSQLSKNDYLVTRDETEIIETLSDRIGDDFAQFLNRNANDQDNGYYIIPNGIKRIKNYLKSHYDIKIRASNLLVKYFKWNYNLKDKDFDLIFLEDFNLVCCSLCYNRNEENNK